MYNLAILQQSCISKFSTCLLPSPQYLTEASYRTLWRYTHSPKSRLWSLLLLPFSEHLQSLSGGVSRPIALNVLNLQLWQLQIICHSEKQLDQVRLNTRTIKELSREFWQLLSRLRGLATTRDTPPSAIVSSTTINAEVSARMLAGRLSAYVGAALAPFEAATPITCACTGGGAHHVHPVPCA